MGSATTTAEFDQNPPLAAAGGRDRLFWMKAGVVGALILTLYYHVLPDLAMDWWNDPGSSHGMLIPPFALYIAWLGRARTLAEPAVPDPRGLWLTLLSCLMLLVGILGAEFFLTRASFVLLLAGLIWTFWGLGRFKTLLFPLVFLLTMIPLPRIIYNLMAAPLQLFASSVATDLVQALGVTVYRDGNVIHLAGISLGVAEACSGLRSLSSLVTASLLVGFLQCTRIRTRVLVVLLSVPIAIGMNVVRVAGTALIAEQNQRYALGYYHSFSGWLVFLVGFGVVAGLAKLLHRWVD
jgi:exosortase